MERWVIYLDNAAATRLDERVLEAMKLYLFDVYAIATSQFGYSPGIEAKEALDAAQAAIAGALGAEPEEVISRYPLGQLDRFLHRPSVWRHR